MSSASRKLRTILVAVLIVAMMALGFTPLALASGKKKDGGGGAGEDNVGVGGDGGDGGDIVVNVGCVQADVLITLLNPKDCESGGDVATGGDGGDGIDAD